MLDKKTSWSGVLLSEASVCSTLTLAEVDTSLTEPIRLKIRQDAAANK
jgi:hypothetical protein